MSFDNSRYTFNPRKDYSGVVMQQGRVQLDADWNEWLAELTRRIRAGTLDSLGRAAYPATTPHAFEITLPGTGALLIGPGRMYVDGLLAENHGNPKDAQWDPALNEMSDTPQPPFASAATGAIDYTLQPYMPAGTALPAAPSGSYLAYLDVWVRPVDYINDPDLVDAAVGVDTTGRLQTVWQVQLLPLTDLNPTCKSKFTGWPPAPSAGLLTTDTTPTAPSGPCCVTSGAAYTGLENQFYRVEIHQKGTPSPVPPVSPTTGATFKWSRDNGSVITAVTGIATVSSSSGSVSQLTVESLGRDQVLGFRPGDWIEVLDDTSEYGQNHGELGQIDTIDVAAKTITLSKTLSGTFDPNQHARIRRWDQSGKVYEKDGTTVWWDIDAQGADIPVPPKSTVLILENGITVSFDVNSAGGAFNVGDFWTFAARTATGEPEKLVSVPPRGIHHHYVALSIVSFPGSATDCRPKLPPAGGEECGCCCTYTVGDGLNTFGKYTSINDAINALPASTGGEVCILPGQYFENVFINGRKDVLLRGCGWQTRIASASLKTAPSGTSVPREAPASSGSGGSSFGAVITISASQHVQLLSFAVEAADGEVGVLIDGTGKLSVPPPAPQHGTLDGPPVRTSKAGPTLDVTIEDLVITASTVPAVLADTVTLLQMESNRVAMKNVTSRWPAVWVSGREIRLVHNWVGLRSKAADLEWLPATVQADLSGLSAPAVTTTAATTAVSGALPLGTGGIQIAGTSAGAATIDVFVIENEIDGAGRNGITLGSLAILDANGGDTGEIAGTTIEIPGPCDTTITLQIPGSKSGQPGTRIVAAGKLANIQINRNRIRNTGACGIGPVGFFDPKAGPEIVMIENLTIAANTISRTLLREVSAVAQIESGAFGAIALPYVENLVIRDNAITDFGSRPGAPVCGIFVLVGQMIDISRNHVLETRDWNLSGPYDVAPGLLRGGIVIAAATPPPFVNPASVYLKAQLAEYTVPSFVPAVPALRVEHNVVRVASGEALEVVGFGPFSIVNNHLSTAGTPRGGATAIAQTVLILNLGVAIEAASLFSKYSTLGKTQTTEPSVSLSRGPTTTSNGTILFTNNICQLEARATKPHFFSSVSILSLDDLIFSNNQCWIDAVSRSGFLDAVLLASYVQVLGNRFQEAALFPVLASGYTAGALNVTAQNISTYCLFCTGTLQPALDANNLSLVPVGACDAVAQKDLHLKFTES